MSDIRVVNTADLQHLNHLSIRQGFNRAMSREAMDRLDPNGTHVLSLILFGHNQDSHPILHHRIQVLAKMTGEADPARGFIDVTDADWTRLMTIAEAEAKAAILADALDPIE